MNNIVYLYVPYCDKEQAKTLGARWDTNKKKWYCEDDKKICVEQWGIRYLDIPYEEREDAKNKGYRWDPDVKKWYCRNY
jgi:hypothetical protein